MNKIYFILLATILAFSVEGKSYRIIDDFSDTPYLARFVPPNSEVYDANAPYDWFSPYTTNPFGYDPAPAYTSFRNNLSNVMGRQRDIIIGHISSMQTAASITCVVNRASGSIPANFQLSLPFSFIGSVYLQYDGVDNTTPSIGSQLGHGIGSDNGAGSNGDGTVDFTFGGAAKGVFITIQTDLPLNYELKAVNIADDTTEVAQGNFIEFLVPVNQVTGFTKYYFTYADAGWSDPTFDWTRVAGFQVKAFTDGTSLTQSIDSRIYLIQIGSLEVGGKVRTDCSCLLALSGIVVDLFSTSPTTVLRESATTDANGNYRFSSTFTSSGGLIDTTATYKICLRDATLARCPNTQPLTGNGCYSFQITDPSVDLTAYDFTISSSTAGIQIPAPANLECNGESTLPTNTGYAFATDCSGTRTQINAWSDSISSSRCVTTISRTWFDPNSLQSGVQVITIRDTIAPIFITAPQDLTQSCATFSTSLSQWVGSSAGAVANDLCQFSRISNDWNQQPLRGCGSVTVSFVAVDVCGLTSSPRRAAFSVISTSGPVFTSQASDLAIECNFRSSPDPNQQITNWINSHGNAAATDPCSALSALTWSNNFYGTTITPANACSFAETVTFSVTNVCSESSATSAVIRVTDSAAPTILVQASDQSAQCSTPTSNNNAFDAWRTAHGNAAAVDACTVGTGLVWSDNYSGSPIACSTAVTVAFTVTDQCGHASSTTATFTLLEDREPPSGSISFPSNSDFVQNAVTVTGTGEVGARVDVVISDSSASTADVQGRTNIDASGSWSVNLNIGGLVDGLITISVTFTDAAGNSITVSSSPTKDSITSVLITAPAPNTVYKTNSLASVEVRGSGESLASVLLSISDSSAVTSDIVRTASVSNGVWSVQNINISPLMDGNINILATITDRAGNTATDQLVIIKDTIVTVSITTPTGDQHITGAQQGNVQILGTGENGASVYVIISDSSLSTADVRTYAVTVSGGSWRIVASVSSLAEGRLTFTAYTSDAGNTASASSTAIKYTLVVVDLTTSAAINSLNAFSYSLGGTGENFGSVYVAATDRNGRSAVSPSTIVNGQSLWSTRADFSGLSDGSVILVAYIVDAEGNTASDSAIVIKDTSTFVTITSPVAINQFNVRNLIVQGTGEPSSTVFVTIQDSASSTANIQTASVSVPQSGNWQVSGVDISSQAEGVIRLTATIVDPVNNRLDSSTISATKDTRLTVAISTPSNNQFVIGQSRVSQINVQGRGDVGASVLVTFSDSNASTPDVVTQSVVITTIGTWSVTSNLTPLQDGTISIVATATDGAGNINLSQTVTLIKDTTVFATIDSPVSGSRITQTQSSSLPISGRGEASGRISLRIAGTRGVVSRTVIVPANGIWSTTVNISNLPNGPITISGTASDVAGNSSPVPVISITKALN